MKCLFADTSGLASKIRCDAIIDALNENGYDVIKLTDYIPFIDEDLPFIYRYIHFLSVTINLIHLHKPKLIISHNAIKCVFLYFALFVTGNRIPIIIELHASGYLEQSSYNNTKLKYVSYVIENIAYKIAYLIVVVSDELKHLLETDFNVDESKVIILNGGIDHKIYFPLAKQGLTPLLVSTCLNPEILIMTAPREFLSNRLAINYMYDIFQLIKLKKSNVILLIFGSGDPIKPVPDGVFYLGYVDDLNAWINSGDVAVIPYPQNAVCSGARTKVLEYWACKVPTISTIEGMRGIPEAINGVHYVCSTYDKHDFANKTLALLSSTTQKNVIATNAYGLIINNYTWEKQTYKFVKLIQSLPFL